MQGSYLKICVTAGASGLDAPVDPRFGRCPFFVVVETDSMYVESVPNSGAGASGGAGIQAAQAVLRLGAQVMIVGGLGPKAVQAFARFGMDVFVGAAGTVKDAIQDWRESILLFS